MGSACALNGVVVIAMAVPVIVNNFQFFYKRDRVEKASRTTEAAVTAAATVILSSQGNEVTPDECV